VTMAHEYGHQNIREAYTVGDGHFEIMEGVATHLGAPDLVANWRDLEWDDVYASR